MKKSEKPKYEAKAQIIKALAHPTRLWMAQQLAEGEKCVCEFADAIDADFSTISKHLSVLKHAGLVSDDKRGKQVFYSLKVPCIMNFITCIDSVLERQAADHVALLK